MAKKADRINVWLLCTECNSQSNVTQLNKKNSPKLELKKHCKKCNKHTSHKSREKLK
jgi:large subunit ribosomal protein L33